MPNLFATCMPFSNENQTHEKFDLSSELREAGFWFFGVFLYKKKKKISVCKSSRIYLKCFLIGSCILSTVKYTVCICTMMIYLFMSVLYILKCCAIRISQSIFKGTRNNDNIDSQKKCTFTFYLDVFSGNGFIIPFDKV